VRVVSTRKYLQRRVMLGPRLAAINSASDVLFVTHRCFFDSQTMPMGHP
jgi:hypothetical protein